MWLPGEARAGLQAEPMERWNAVLTEGPGAGGGRQGRGWLATEPPCRPSVILLWAWRWGS